MINSNNNIHGKEITKQGLNSSEQTKKIVLEEYTVKKYKVGSYVFDSKQRAEIILDAINDPDKMVCTQCHGKGDYIGVTTQVTGNGGVNEHEWIPCNKDCDKCNGKGYLVRSSKFIKL
jgi:hypothetical protein